MTGPTPDALGLHRVPNGARIPAGVPYMWPTRDGWVITTETHGIEQHRLDVQRWTAEPIEASLIMDGGIEAPKIEASVTQIEVHSGWWTALHITAGRIVVELAEPIEAQS